MKVEIDQRDGIGKGVFLRTVSLMVTTALTLSGCGEVRKTFGLDPTPPDEFSVVEHAPLEIPPDFKIRAPQPGAERPQEKAVRQQAQEAILAEDGSEIVNFEGAGETASVDNRYTGIEDVAIDAPVIPAAATPPAPGAASATPSSEGEVELLAQVAPAPETPLDRHQLDIEATKEAQPQNVITFPWQQKPAGQALDPEEEQARLKTKKREEQRAAILQQQRIAAGQEAVIALEASPQAAAVVTPVANRPSDDFATALPTLPDQPEQSSVIAQPVASPQPAWQVVPAPAAAKPVATTRQLYGYVTASGKRAHMAPPVVTRAPLVKGGLNVNSVTKARTSSAGCRPLTPQRLSPEELGEILKQRPAVVKKPAKKTQRRRPKAVRKKARTRHKSPQLTAETSTVDTLPETAPVHITALETEASSPDVTPAPQLVEDVTQDPNPTLGMGPLPAVNEPATMAPEAGVPVQPALGGEGITSAGPETAAIKGEGGAVAPVAVPASPTQPTTVETFEMAPAPESLLQVPAERAPAPLPASAPTPAVSDGVPVPGAAAEAAAVKAGASTPEEAEDPKKKAESPLDPVMAATGTGSVMLIPSPLAGGRGQ